jgi:predicted dehydrogenase
VSFYSLMNRDGGPAIVDRDLKIVRDEPLRAELEAFVRVVASGESPECGGAEGRAALDLAHKIITAMKR